MILLFLTTLALDSSDHLANASVSEQTSIRTSVHISSRGEYRIVIPLWVTRVQLSLISVGEAQACLFTQRVFCSSVVILVGQVCP